MIGYNFDTLYTLVYLSLILEKDRIKFNINKPLNSLSKAILLTDVNNPENTIILPSLGKCIEFLKSKNLSASQTTLVKYIKLGKAYKGYICKFL